MSDSPLRPVFRPKSIAVFGGEAGAGTPGGELARNLLHGGFDGPILPVHPSAPALRGTLTYRSIEALPLTPDLALIASPAGEVPGLLDQLGRRGTRAAVVYATDFAAAGAAAAASLRQRMMAAARPHRLRIIGPACLGIIVPSLGLNATYAASPCRAGDLAFVTESGSILDAVLGWAAGSGVGFSLAASLGDAADVDVGEVLDYLSFDPLSRAVLLYVERIVQPRRFLSAARALARIKPVIVYRPAAIGETPVLDCEGQPLIDSDLVFDAAFQRAGMLPVAQLSDLIAATRTVSMRRRPAGDRLAIIANGRGLATAVADVVRVQGGVLSSLSAATGERLDRALPPGWGGRNPVNVFPDAGADRFRAAVDAVVDDAGSDVAVVILGPTATGDRTAAAAAVAEALGATKMPGIAVWLGTDADGAGTSLAANGIPVYDNFAAAVTAVLQLTRFRRNQDMLMQTPDSTPELFASDLGAARAIVEAALAAGRDALSDDEGRAILAAYRVPLAPPASAAAGPAAAGAHFAQPLRIAVGIDAAIGPVIVFGPGGLPKGIAIDRGVALPPLNLTLARMLMDGTRIGGVLAALGPGYAHTGAELALALVKVSQILTDLPEVVGLDIDPLLADAHGIVAEGCRVRIAPAGAHPHRRLAIRPYPRELEKLVTTRRGQTLLLRPMRPEDEPALRTFVRNLDPNDIRLRFFSPIKELDPRFAARLTQIDYDREMAFVAVDPAAPDGGLWGVMRVSADANAVSAEYAGAVRSDLKGHGLGRLMMEEIIAYARSRGIEEIWGSVLAENTPMLALNRKLGFQIKTDPDDRSVVHVSLSLAGQAGTPPPTPPVQGS